MRHVDATSALPISINLLDSTQNIKSLYEYSNDTLLPYGHTYEQDISVRFRVEL